MKPPFKEPYFRRGEPWIWASGASLAFILLLALLLACVVAANAFPVFWPAPLEEVTLADGQKFMGTPLRRSIDPVDGAPRVQHKIANRDLTGGLDFRWTRLDQIASSSFPKDAARLERTSHGDFHGRLTENGPDGSASPLTPAAFQKTWAEIRRRNSEITKPPAADLSRASEQLRGLRMDILKWERASRLAIDDAQRRAADERLRDLQERSLEIKEYSDRKAAELSALRAEIASSKAIFTDARGVAAPIAFVDVVRADWPNNMSLGSKLLYAAAKFWSLLADPPREANTEGGLRPAIFGTVFLVFFMAISSFPLGVLAGVYLREYAKDNWFTRVVRVAVNNLAGIPSIVYGIFGLGFFVYGLGGGLDAWLYPERVEAGVTTFGTGGMLWAGLTLGLLTLPVVIVATEEALAAVPSEIRQGALALGATRFQSLTRVLAPMASPGILTGFILAMARAAGEVAPLMLTGVVKSAPAMVVDGSWPYVHLERKFMHLGFHIYDVGFQSPNVEAARPMVYATALLLLALVFALNAAAIRLRNRMRRKYRTQAV